MNAFIEFVQQWGYWAVFLGSLVEGESVILTASAMARLGHLNIYKVALIAFCGTLIADQGLFFVGRYYGDAIFTKFPTLKQKSTKAFELLHKYDAAYIIACRFIYGIRTLSPIVIGAAGVKPARFIPLNFISALVWATISCTGGYLLGEVMLKIFEYFFMAQQYLIAAVVGGLVLIFAGMYIRRYLKEKKK
jgi:membrane protein DedA with SNARE-associated domain